MQLRTIYRVGLILLLAVSLGFQIVYAQAQGPNIEEIKTKLIQALVALQAVAWVIIAIGWITGNIAIAVPGGGRIVKRSGREMIELSGLSMFLILFGPLLIAILISIIGSIPWPGTQTP
jgi:hypothetical protein